MTTFLSLDQKLQAKIFSYLEGEKILEVRSVCKSFQTVIENNVGLDCTLEGYIQRRGCSICPGNESMDLYKKLKFFFENDTFIRRLTLSRWYPEKDQYNNTVIRKLVREPDKLEWVTLRRLEMEFLHETLNCTKLTLAHLTHISVTEITTRYNMKRMVSEQKYKNSICMEQLLTFNLRVEFTADEHDFLESFYLLLIIKAPKLKELGIIAEYKRKHDNLQLEMTCNLFGVVAHFMEGCEKLKELWIWKTPTVRDIYPCGRCDVNNVDATLRDFPETIDRVEEDDLHSSTKVPTQSLEQMIKYANNPKLNELMALNDTIKKVELVKQLLSESRVTSLESLNVRMGTPRESVMYNGLVEKQRELKNLKVQLDYLNVGSDENPPWKQILTNMVEPVKETIENLGLTARFKKTVDLAQTFRGYSKLKTLHLWQYGGGRSVSRGERQHHYSHFQFYVRWLAPKKLGAFADQFLGFQEYPFINAHERFIIERNVEERWDIEEENEEAEEEIEESDEEDDGEEMEVEDPVEDVEMGGEGDEEADDEEQEDVEPENANLVVVNNAGDNNAEANQEIGEEDREDDDDNAEHENEVDELDFMDDEELEGIRPKFFSDEEDSDDADYCLSANSPEPDVEIKLREIGNNNMEIQMFPNVTNLQIADSFPVLEKLSLSYMNILPSEFSKSSILDQFGNLKIIDIDMGRDVTVFHDVFGIQLVDLLELTKLRKLNRLRILPIKCPGRDPNEGVEQYYRRILNNTHKRLVREGVLEMPSGYY